MKLIHLLLINKFLELKEISINFSKSVENALNRMKVEGFEIWMLSRLKFKVKYKVEFILIGYNNN